MFRNVRSAYNNGPNGGARREPRNVIAWIVGINTVVFGLWVYAKDRAMRSGDPGMYWFMMRNFTTGEGNLRAGRWWTVLTYCVSHQSLPHFAFNMLTFLFTGPALLPIIGPARMLQLYFGAGIFSALASAAWPFVLSPMLGNSARQIARKRHSFSQGASGAC